MHKDRKCSHCGGLDEFLYEMDWKPVYYCATCDVESGSGAEMAGPDERREEKAGE
jgi:hypothetical protein